MEWRNHQLKNLQLSEPPMWPAYWVSHQKRHLVGKFDAFLTENERITQNIRKAAQISERAKGPNLKQIKSEKIKTNTEHEKRRWESE